MMAASPPHPDHPSREQSASARPVSARRRRRFPSCAPLSARYYYGTVQIPRTGVSKARGNREARITGRFPLCREEFGPTQFCGGAERLSVLSDHPLFGNDQLLPDKARWTRSFARPLPPIASTTTSARREELTGRFVKSLRRRDVRSRFTSRTYHTGQTKRTPKRAAIAGADS